MNYRALYVIFDMVVLHLVEIVNKEELTDRCWHEPYFAAKEFKPVDETKLDQFRKHLELARV